MAYDRCDGDGDVHCYRILAIMHMIVVMAMVVDTVLGLNS